MKDYQQESVGQQERVDVEVGGQDFGSNAAMAEQLVCSEPQPSDGFGGFFFPDWQTVESTLLEPEEAAAKGAADETRYTDAGDIAPPHSGVTELDEFEGRARRETTRVGDQILERKHQDRSSIDVKQGQLTWGEQESVALMRENAAETKKAAVAELDKRAAVQESKVDA